MIFEQYLELKHKELNSTDTFDLWKENITADEYIKWANEYGELSKPKKEVLNQITITAHLEDHGTTTAKITIPEDCFEIKELPKYLKALTDEFQNCIEDDSESGNLFWTKAITKER